MQHYDLKVFSTRRRDERIKLHREISVSHVVGRFVGTTENLSVRGAMLTVPGIDPEPERGDRVEVSFTLPGLPDPIVRGAIVRWVSTVLEDMIGIEFDEPLEDDARKLLDLLAKQQQGSDGA